MNGTVSSCDLILVSDQDLFSSAGCRIVFQDILQRIGDDTFYNPILAKYIPVLHFLKTVVINLLVDKACLVKNMKYLSS